MKNHIKFRKAFLLILSIALLIIRNGQAQSPASPLQIFPPNLQTQSFEKYIPHATTEYNGLAQIKGLKISITLSWIRLEIVLESLNDNKLASHIYALMVSE